MEEAGNVRHHTPLVWWPRVAQIFHFEELLENKH